MEIPKETVGSCTVELAMVETTMCWIIVETICHYALYRKLNFQRVSQILCMQIMT
jgi:hypothetical protein